MTSFDKAFIAWCMNTGIRPRRIVLPEEKWRWLMWWWFVPPGVYVDHLLYRAPWGLVRIEPPNKTNIQ